jgi:hypothetical protein
MAKLNLKTDINLNLGVIILIAAALVILIGGGFTLHSKKVNKLETELLAEVNLKNALIDSMSTYRNKEKEWVAEKLTIQGSVKELEKENLTLTNSQKELLTRVKNVEKEKNQLKQEKEVIAAALIETQLIVDSLKHQGETVVDTTSKQVSFTDLYQKTIDDVKYTMKYDFVVGNVLPANPLEKPSFLIKSLSFPNEQFVDFHWNKDKKKGYPISFSVSNSNGFYQTANIESYAIPNLKKEIINPTGWQKIGSFFRENGNKAVYIGIGGAIGVGTYIILTK